jgi:peptidoglycan/xylan/chitin deacetylase (PgdA/CDA1 family)
MAIEMANMRILSIMYHDVVENGDFDSSGFPGEGSHVYKLRLEDFVRHLEAIAAVTTSVGTVRDLSSSPVLLTFDDGGSSAHGLIAGLLEARGWRGHFFVTTNRIGTPGFLTEAEIRDLHRRGHIVGSHSHTHPTRMSVLTRAQLDCEWRQSLARLSDIVGEPVKVASVPGGFYARHVGESAQACGIEALFTSEPTARVASLNGCHVFGRYVVQRDMGPNWSAGFATGRLAECGRQALLWKAKLVAKAIGGSAYLRLREAVIHRNSR